VQNDQGKGLCVITNGGASLNFKHVIHVRHENKSNTKSLFDLLPGIIDKHALQSITVPTSDYDDAKSTRGFINDLL
jgi:hypothetical protein